MNDISISKKILINELFTEILDKFMIPSTNVLGKALQKQAHVLKLFSDWWEEMASGNFGWGLLADSSVGRFLGLLATQVSW